MYIYINTYINNFEYKNVFKISYYIIPVNINPYIYSQYMVQR